MALNKGQLQNAIEVILSNMYQRTDNPEAAHEYFAQQLANAIDVYVKQAKITIPSGGVIVTGSATTQNNPSPIIVDNALS